MKQFGSQCRETLLESGYELVKVEDDEAILRNPAVEQFELWVKHDDHAGYTIEINGVGYEFVRSAKTFDEL
jgi:hypothetical protein